ncbi:MAG: DNA-binding response regulator [Balneolaceae bacterium]|nr:MAG: DNA-binding response regulator [Balneolaceae bacterium]
MKIIHIIIAEVFDIYRAGLNAVLNEYANFRVVDSVKTAKDLLKAYKKNSKAVCMVSSSLPDSNIHELMKELKKINPQARAIILTHSTDLAHLNQSLKAGIKGYLTKNVTVDELTDVILVVESGEQGFSKSVSQAMIGKYADITRRGGLPGKKTITKREKEIMKLIVEGHTSAEIAKQLYISTRTVETHRSNLMNKLELKNTAELVRFAIEEQNLL